jgi:hypothetical protein
MAVVFEVKGFFGHQQQANALKKSHNPWYPSPAKEEIQQSPPRFPQVKFVDTEGSQNQSQNGRGEFVFHGRRGEEDGNEQGRTRQYQTAKTISARGTWAALR